MGRYTRAKQGTSAVGRVSKGWRVKRENNNSITCSLIKTPTVFIESVPRHKMLLLMEKYPHQEWLGYMVGRVSESENFFIEDLVIPPHAEASSGSAEAEPFHIPDNCVGIVHSHHSMGAFHSGTDQSYVDKNFPVSITVAKKGDQAMEFDAVSYQVTPCGKGTTTKVSVKYVQPEPTFDTGAFLEEAAANVDKGKRKYTPVVVKFGQQGYLPYQGNGEGQFTNEHGVVMSKKELEEYLGDTYEGGWY